MNYLQESGDPRYLTFNDYSTSVASLKNAPKRKLNPVELEKARLHEYIQYAAGETNPILTLKAHRDLFANKHRLPDGSFTSDDAEILDWFELWIQEFKAVQEFTKDFEPLPDFLREA